MGKFEIKDNFYLDGKPFQIISGAIHYFRIVPEYWQDRLEKLNITVRRSRQSGVARATCPD